MGIGTTIRRFLGVPIVDRLPTNVVYDTLEEALAAGEVIFQGDPQAVTPMADETTGRLAPEIPGGLQMKRTMVVLQATPVPMPVPDASPPTPPPGGNRLTDGASNYLTDGAGNYLTT